MLAICFFSRFFGVVSRSELGRTDFLFLKNIAHTREHFCCCCCCCCFFIYISIYFSGVQAEYLIDKWNKWNFWDSLRSFRWSHPSEKVTIWCLQILLVPIVWIKLNSIQAIEVGSVFRIVCDLPGSVSLWSSRSPEHYLKRQGRSGICERSYGNRLNQLDRSWRFQSLRSAVCMFGNRNVTQWLYFTPDFTINKGKSLCC